MLTTYICELLFTHECVIVPGFGGFLSTPVAAEFHAKSQMLYPPYKRIAFNVGLRGNDGLLANHIALLKGISYNDAQSFIEKSVNTWLNELGRDKQLNLPKIGTFINNNGNWIFKADTSINYNAHAYGLAPIHVSAINPNKSKVEPNKENRPPMHHPEKPSKEKLYRNIAIAMPVAFLLVLAALNPATMSRIYTAGLGFFSSSRPVDVAPKPLPIVKRSNADTTVVDAVAAYSEKRYYIVAGCFQDMNNAKHLVIELRKKGYPATLAGTRKGMTVVSYMNFANKHEALMGFDKIQREDPYVWVMRK